MQTEITQEMWDLLTCPYTESGVAHDPHAMELAIDETMSIGVQCEGRRPRRLIEAGSGRRPDVAFDMVKAGRF